MKCDYLSEDRKNCSVKNKYLPDWHPNCHYQDYPGLDPFFCSVRLLEDSERGKKSDFIGKWEREQ